MAARAAKTPRGEWLGGRGWDQNRWPERQWPTRASLDRAAPHHPVALTRIDGHATWANSAALAAAGIDRATPEPAGGRILRDALRQPTGVLIDTAQRLIQRAEPRPSAERFDQAVTLLVGCRGRVILTGMGKSGIICRKIAATFASFIE